MAAAVAHMLGPPVIGQSTDVQPVRVGRLAGCFTTSVGHGGAVTTPAVDAEHAGVDGGVRCGGSQQDTPVWVVLAGPTHLQETTVQ
jgi:hypothetical protein